MLCFQLFFGINAHLLAGPVVDFIDNTPVNQSKEGVIPATAHIPAGMKTCTPLTDENTAGAYNLVAVPFDSQPFGVAIPSISGAADTFFMSK